MTGLPELDLLVKNDHRDRGPANKIWKLHSPSVVLKEMRAAAGAHRSFYEGFVEKEFDKTVRVSVLQRSVVYELSLYKSAFEAGPPGFRRSVLIQVSGEPGMPFRCVS